MTDTQVAALSAQDLRNPDPKASAAALSLHDLRNPDPKASAAALSIHVLQQVRKIIPADVRVAGEAVQLLDQHGHPSAWLAGLSAQALVPLPEQLPDNGLPFQWHQLDATGAWTAPVERSTALTAYSCSYGRQAVSGAVPPTSLTCTLAARHTTAPEIGELFRIVVTSSLTGGAQLPRIRFTGEVTDVTYDPAGDDGRGLITVTAVGRLARRAARQLDLTGAPVELDGARVVRVLDTAGVELGMVDGGQAKLAAPTAPAAGAALLDEVTTSSTGLVIEQRDGTVDYHDAEHRRGARPVTSLGADEILSAFTWTKRLGELVNVARITYGTEPTTSTVEVRDGYSVDAHNERVDERTTALLTADDAYDLGSIIVGRRSTPAWELPTVTVDLLRTVTPAKRAKLLALAVADRVSFTGLPAGGDYTEAELFVEGATENAQVLAGEVLPTIERTRWQLSLTVADPSTSGTTLRWIDAPDATTWENVDPALSWLDLARVEKADPLQPLTPDP